MAYIARNFINIISRSPDGLFRAYIPERTFLLRARECVRNAYHLMRG